MRRIAKELGDIHKDKGSDISVRPAGSDEDISHLKGVFTGPSGTPYEGGKFTIDITMPSDYPFKAPTMKFDTQVWHPNVSSVTVSL